MGRPDGARFVCPRQSLGDTKLHHLGDLAALFQGLDVFCRQLPLPLAGEFLAK